MRKHYPTSFNTNDVCRLVLIFTKRRRALGSHRQIAKIVTFFILVGAFTLATSQAEARDLVEAAQSAQTMFNRIGIAAISIGITLGGILFALGASQIGRLVLFSGLIGACAVLGAPAIISLLGRIFGAAT